MKFIKVERNVIALGFNRPKKKARHGWVSKSGKVTLSAKDWKKLVTDVWFRAQGQCENTIDGNRCHNRANDPHHILWRSRGGGDSLDNVAAACRQCHNLEHDGKQTFILWKEVDIDA